MDGRVRPDGATAQRHRCAARVATIPRAGGHCTWLAASHPDVVQCGKLVSEGRRRGVPWNTMMKIYLAGFDVFRPDAVAYGEQLKALCQSRGHVGLYPLDHTAPAGLKGAALAGWIYRANTALIRECDLVMANLNPFRGAEPDSGTAFEVGYAVALGKSVWGYTGQAGALVQQVSCTSAPGSRHVDGKGYLVEDFGLNLNLMLACSAQVVVGDARACLDAIGPGGGPAQGPRG